MAIASRAMMIVCAVLAVAAAAAGFHAAVSFNPFIGISGFMLVGFASVTFWMAVKARE